jgi:hypothetical protein
MKECMGIPSETRQLGSRVAVQCQHALEQTSRDSVVKTPEIPRTHVAAGEWFQYTWSFSTDLRVYYRVGNLATIPVWG